MAELGANVLTLSDWAKRLDPDGKVSAIAELLSQQNQILDDMLFMEANQATSHRSSVRTGLPSVYWRLVNQGVQPSKSTTAQIDEAIGMLEAYSEVDVALAELNGNVGAFRLSEAQAFLEAMNQEMASTVFYGNSGAAPEEFNGLDVRYGDLSAGNSQNILDAGGTGSDNSSIYLVVWGSNSVHGLFPKGSKAGLSHEDLGKVTVEVTAGIAGSRMRAYQDHFKWCSGLAVKDWRYVVRICNIDISLLIANGGSQADLTNFMIKAIHRIPNLNQGKPVFYMNRTVYQMLDIQRRDDVITGGGLNYKDVDGKRIADFRGIPVKICDALIETEARIV
jgi:hypothetical protein